MRNSSNNEKPVRRTSRRLVDWLKPSHGTKVHSLVDKIYHPGNLRLAWKRVRSNRGSGGVDGESLEDFEPNLEENLQRLHEELREKTYRPRPVREHLIPKAGQPWKYRKLDLREERIKSGARRGTIYRYPTQQSLDTFKEKVRRLTRRNNGLSTRQQIERINPLLRGWGNYYREANVRKLFNRLDRWVVRRIWSHRRKRWRNCGWKELPEPRLYRELGLVNLVSLIGGIHERGQAPKLL